MVLCVRATMYPKMPRPILLSALFAAIVVLAVALSSELAGRPSTTEAAAFRTADAPRRDRDGQRLVRDVYDRFRRYTETAAGDRVEISLAEFRTVDRSALDSVALYPDLATLGSDWALVATPSVLQGTDGQATVRYHAEWLPAENLAERPDTAAFLGRTVAEMTALLANRLHVDRARTLAITSYRVTVSFDGHEETYRAAVRWFHGADGRLRLSIIDVVVHGLALARAEVVPPARRVELAPEAATALFRRTEGTAPSACVARHWPTVVARPANDNAGDDDHLSGDHRALFAASFDCSCDTACVSRCEAHVDTARCEDVGLLDEPGTVHRIQGRTAVEATAVARGEQEGARCVAALDCYAERCLGAECSEVTIDSPETPFAEPLLTVSLVGSHRTSESHLCARCPSE